ncbi:MAG: DNA adenine methylase [Candidatus Parcubacteria bacterium]|nr:DNA adenine methylase [Candidatus Paceibacterota bacterium]
MKNKNPLLQPFLKWVGGKRQLLPEIRKLVPKKYNSYYEPFLGAGAVLFDLKPKKAVVNDLNEELINCYKAIKEELLDLIKDLKNHKNTSEYFYELRQKDRTAEYGQLTSYQKASRIIYLNKTCFNGLFRVNSQGQFNAPFGRYANPSYLNEPVLTAVRNYLTENDITITNSDFTESLQTAKKGDFVYIDPPYDPISDTASFTGYNLNQFYQNDQRRLKTLVDELNNKGCHILLSNSSTDFIRDLYKDYNIRTIKANRNINSNAEKRGKVDELLIYNYDLEIC